MTAKTATPMTDAIRTVGTGGDCRDWKEERVEALKLARKLESDRARLIEALKDCKRDIEFLQREKYGSDTIMPSSYNLATSLLRELEGK